MTTEAHKSLFDEGILIRRAVLGDDYVANAINNANDFTRPFQDLVTEYCWGMVWARPGLTRKVRSLINLAMLTALNRPRELELHVRGALNNGVTEVEIQEVLLQTAIYCGVPSATEAFGVARKVLDERRASNGEGQPSS